MTPFNSSQSVPFADKRLLGSPVRTVRTVRTPRGYVSTIRTLPWMDVSPLREFRG